MYELFRKKLYRALVLIAEKKSFYCFVAVSRVLCGQMSDRKSRSIMLERRSLFLSPDLSHRRLSRVNSVYCPEHSHVTLRHMHPPTSAGNGTMGKGRGLSIYKYTFILYPSLIVQELCESRGGRPELSVLTSLLASVDVKIY